ncbi:MAG: protein-glutamine gamma-glutamyltransferase [Oscillospiraceae bacterium]|nr:protein-glutamine gamma-glutamyltransferase [Oscillospiraceae bacterium]
MTQQTFESKLRQAIAEAAIALNRSGLRFAVFKNARCNEDYWTLSSNGGWRLSADNGQLTVDSASAIRDIYANGHLYATECATAMLIVYYKAILETYGDDLFNKTFKSIYLMDWDIRDPLLKSVGTMQDLRGASLTVGDRAYFANPDHAPELPQWQGENVIVLGDGRYYGHGIGIARAEQILASLNAKRKDGNPRDAYLMDKAARPDWKKLADVLEKSERGQPVAVWREFAPALLTPRRESRPEHISYV